MQIRDILRSENIYTISGELTVHQAAKKMTELDIGALIVGTPEKIEGIFSERDILKKVVGVDLSTENTKVKDVMSSNLTVVDDMESAHIALNIMQKKKFRHLPVVNNKGLCVGVLGIRSLMKSVSENIQNENNVLVRQIVIDEEEDF